MESSPRTERLSDSIAERQRARAKTAAQLEKCLRQIIARQAPRLYAQEDGAGLDSDALEKILSELETVDAGRRAKSLRHTLRKILVGLQKATGGSVELPAPEIVLRRAPSPFAPDRYGQVPALSQMVEAFFADLHACPDVDSEIAAGRLVFSAITFGGLLHPSLVKKFCPLVTADLYQEGDFCWLDLQLPDASDGANNRVRRWFPDPVSQCLIGRWQAASHCWPEGNAGTPIALVRKLHARLGGAPFPPRQNALNALISAAQTRLRLLIPGVLVDFLASDDHGQSLTSRSWWRLVADWHLDQPPPNNSDQELADEIAAASEAPEKEPSEYQLDSSDDLSTFALLKSTALKHDKAYRYTKSALAEIQKLRAHVGPSGPMLTAILDWSEWSMLTMSSGSQRAKPQSVYRYLNSFAKALIAAAGELDPALVPSSELQEKYEMVLTSIVSTKERGYAARCLRNFHSFLVLTRDVAPVEIDGIVADRVDVRANTISEHDYSRTFYLLETTNMDVRFRRMLRIMLILAYRLGLRRKELAYLRLEDVHDDSLSGVPSVRPLLWFHSHPESALKTRGSVRRLPLAHLLTPKELKSVLQWKQFRIREAGLNRTAMDLMFCLPGRNTERVADADIDVIVRLLRHVCNDQTIVLHSLRHTALSNLFVRLFIAEIDRVSFSKVNCPWLDRAPHWQSLIKRMFATTSLPREAAYLISAFAGHIDPTETLHTYVHHQDWIAGLYLRGVAQTLPLAVWATFEGIGVDALSVRHSRQKQQSGKKVIACVDTPKRLLRSVKTSRPPGSEAEFLPEKIDLQEDVRDQLERLPLEGVYCMLALAARSMSDVAREHVSGVDRRVFKNLVAAAQTIAKEKTSTRNVEARRSRWLAKQPKRPRPGLSKLPQLDGFGPAIPREKSDRKDAREAYRRALLASSSTTIEDLYFLLGHTSHTDPVVTARSLEEVARLTSMLGDLGTPRRKIRIEIQSLPRTISSTDLSTIKKWRQTVATAANLPLAAVTLASADLPTTNSSRTHPGGRMAIQIVQEPRASAAKKGEQEVHRLACGWRVGSYYALCVKLALRSGD